MPNSISRIVCCLAASIAFGFAGCSGGVAQPPNSSARSGAPDLTADGTPNRVVIFSARSVPSDLAARVSALGGAVEQSYDAVGVAIVSGLSDVSAAALAASSDVKSVAVDHELQLLDDPAPSAPEVADVAPATPGDPALARSFARQWHLRAIGADKAWAAGQLGSSAVRVAILDTGIDYAHPDLAGLVDLSRSKSFVPSDDRLVAQRFPGKNPVTDLHFHGTHVAATVSSNALAAAGVTSRTSLMAVKVLSVTGSGSTSGVLAGIVFATDNGADIISMSLGIPALLNAEDPTVEAFIETVNRAFDYAESQGVTVVVAAGNERQNVAIDDTFKPFCGAASVICVSATGPTSSSGINGPWQDIDAFAFYSNFGTGAITVAAPGGNRGGAVWEACSTTSLQIPVCQTGTFIVGLIGTSMATPHTSALAALLAARLGHGESGAIRSVIEDTADHAGPLANEQLFGHGRINVARALGLAP